MSECYITAYRKPVTTGVFMNKLSLQYNRSGSQVYDFCITLILNSHDLKTWFPNMGLEKIIGLFVKWNLEKENLKYITTETLGVYLTTVLSVEYVMPW